MGCQKNIAKQIVAKKGDYLLMVKGNQPKLLEAIEIAFIDQHGVESVDRSALVERGHGRTVGQIASVLSAKGIVDPGDWPKCVTIGRIDSMRVVGDKESDLERRYHQLARPLRRATGCRGASALGRGEPASLDPRRQLQRGRQHGRQGQCAAEPVDAAQDRAQHHPRRQDRHAQEGGLRLKRKGRRGMTGAGAHAGDQINMLGECGARIVPTMHRFRSPARPRWRSSVRLWIILGISACAGGWRPIWHAVEVERCGSGWMNGALRRIIRPPPRWMSGRAEACKGGVAALDERVRSARAGRDRRRAFA